MPSDIPTTALFIGRFQPPHLGHLAIMAKALEQGGQLLVLLGSANLARSARNPFSVSERTSMLRAALGNTSRRVRFAPLSDAFDEPRWAANVRAVAPAKPVLIGFEKDASSHYLRWFPDWPLKLLPAVQAEFDGLHATNLRVALWQLDWQAVAPHVHPSTLDFLQTFSRVPAFQRLAAEHRAVQLDRSRAGSDHIWYERFGIWNQAGQVALVRRTEAIGAGLWSLPLVNSTSNELLDVFSHPARSLLGLSEARVYRLPERPAGTFLADLSTVQRNPRSFFEDHAIILSRLARS